jgi:hypothetical protein
MRQPRNNIDKRDVPYDEPQVDDPVRRKISAEINDTRMGSPRNRVHPYDSNTLTAKYVPTSPIKAGAMIDSARRCVGERLIFIS